MLPWHVVPSNVVELSGCQVTPLPPLATMQCPGINGTILTSYAYANNGTTSGGNLFGYQQAVATAWAEA